VRLADVYSFRLSVLFALSRVTSRRHADSCRAWGEAYRDNYARSADSTRPFALLQICDNGKTNCLLTTVRNSETLYKEGLEALLGKGAVEIEDEAARERLAQMIACGERLVDHLMEDMCKLPKEQAAQAQAEADRARARADELERELAAAEARVAPPSRRRKAQDTFHTPDAKRHTGDGAGPSSKGATPGKSVRRLPCASVERCTALLCAFLCVACRPSLACAAYRVSMAKLCVRGQTVRPCVQYITPPESPPDVPLVCRSALPRRSPS